MFLLLSCLPLITWSQSKLYLFHPQSEQQTVFQTGDLVSLIGPDGLIKGRINHMSDSSLWLNIETHPFGTQETNLRSYREQIPLQDVQAVAYNNPRWRRFQRGYSGATLAIGGVVFLGTTCRTLVTDAPPRMAPLAIATLLLSSGLVVRYVGRDRYNMKRGWELQVGR